MMVLLLGKGVLKNKIKQILQLINIHEFLNRPRVHAYTTRKIRSLATHGRLPVRCNAFPLAANNGFSLAKYCKRATVANWRPLSGNGNTLRHRLLIVNGRRHLNSTILFSLCWLKAISLNTITEFVQVQDIVLLRDSITKCKNL